MSVALALDSDVTLAQRGDRDAFSRLVDACRGVVCAITLAIVRDVATSEDVAQEVFVSAFQSLDKLRNPSSFLPWIRQLARNQAKELVRARSRFGRRHAPWEDDATSAADPTPNAGEAMIDREERRALAEAIDELPDEAREIVTLFYREGSSVKQVADLLGLREDAVKKRLERARVALRASLLERAAETLRKSAPGAGFTAGVVAAIALATPGTAAAAGAGISAASKVAGAGASAAKVGVLGGTLFGAASGLGAILFGSRYLWKKARDRRERMQIAWFTVVNLGAILFASFASHHSASFGRALVLVNWTLFALVIGLSYTVWLPRIIARRLAKERLEDPTAAARQRRQRIRGIIGTVVGVVLSLAGVLYGLMHR